MSDQLPAPTRLVNPWQGSQDCRVQANLDGEVFRYFFRGVFAGDRGPRATLICLFFQALYEECRNAGIPDTWDEDSERRVAEIMSRLNFNEPKTE